MDPSTHWGSLPFRRKTAEVFRKTATGRRTSLGAAARGPATRAGLTPERDRPLGAGLAAVALLAGLVGLSSGWFGAPPVPTTGIARSTQARLVEPLPLLRSAPLPDKAGAPSPQREARPGLLQASAVH
ncbi:hypothetical protein [Oceanicola sp. S124]|uniref:hypothetical protein n=1 Tax=Oceanicola sp. S124 TaxID=1042378 RepID=UPI0002558636|nr:hypothetical protein [Oceanicola sp. S124]